MATIWKVLCLVIVLALCYGVSHWAFDTIVNSDLSPFWKWMLLRG